MHEDNTFVIGEKVHGRDDVIIKNDCNTNESHLLVYEDKTYMAVDEVDCRNDSEICIIYADITFVIMEEVESKLQSGMQSALKLKNDDYKKQFSRVPVRQDDVTTATDHSWLTQRNDNRRINDMQNIANRQH